MFKYLCRFSMILSSLSFWSCHASENLLDFENFMQEWNQFIQSKSIDHHQIGTEAYREVEFSLLDEFSRQQVVRHRPYLSTIDRYNNCRPYVENKISLLDGTEMSASFIQFSNLGPNYHNFIATQAPFQHNISIFWQMILEQEIDQIVMVTELVEIERPSRNLACSYWPEKMGERMILDHGLEVTLIEESELLSEFKEKIQIRKFNLLGQGKDKIVTHYWYRNWIDNTAPTQIQTISTLMDVVEQQKNDLGSNSPVLVHCSAGVGRTGAFIAFYHLMQRRKYESRQINLFNFIGYLRWQRPYLVGTYSQYKFCYKINSNF